MVRFALSLSLFVLLLAAPTARAGSWLRPVDGPVLRAFAVGRDPYAGGWHRGVDLAAARGSPVRSACPGRVSFAGRVPRGGSTVSVRCGAIVATYQQLGSIAVRAGGGVARGSPIGTVGASSDPRQPRSHLHLGARRAATGRYLDPLDLLRGAGPALPALPPAARTPPRAAPLGPAPEARRIAPGRPLPASPRLAPARPLPALPRAAPVAPRGAILGPGRALPGLRPARPVPAPSWRPPAGPAGEPEATSPGFEPGVPRVVWIGLACAGLGLPIGGFVRLRSRRRASSRVERTA